jgi:hypothetical protein
VERVEVYRGTTPLRFAQSGLAVVARRERSSRAAVLNAPVNAWVSVVG